MATKKISELSTYTESSISDATQALVPLDDLTVVGTGKTKHMSFAEQAKWFGANLPKLVVNSGTLTASTPFTFSQTWNNVAVSFRGVKIAVTDSASAATSLPLEVLGGAGGVTNLLSARTDGVVQAGTEMRSPLFSTRSDSGEYRLGASDDLLMVRVAADHLGVRRGANAQSLSVFNNYVSGSVYERGRFGWNANVLQIGTEHVGGSTRAISFIVGGSEKLLMHTNGGLYVASGGLVYSPEFRTGAGHYTIISAPSEGVTLLTDSTLANYARMALGGITNAFPSIARSGANIQIKLADNSALTGLEASVLTASLYVAAPDIWANSNSGRLAIGSSVDLTLYREAANHLALRNGANPQLLSLYYSYTSPSVYLRGNVGWDDGVFVLGTSHVGVGTSGVGIKTNGITRMQFNAGDVGIKIPNNTYFETTENGNNYFQIGTAAYNFASLSSIRFIIDSDSNSTTEAVIFGKDSASMGSITELARITEAGLLTFGGITSSQPAIKPSGTSLQIRLADDSAFTKIQGQLQTHANAVSEAIVPTHTLTLYDAAGTAYKVAVQAA